MSEAINSRSGAKPKEKPLNRKEKQPPTFSHAAARVRVRVHESSETSIGPLHLAIPFLPPLDHVFHLPVRRAAMRPLSALLARHHITMHRRTKLQE